MPFPLLQCPDAVAVEIFKNMPHQELFLLSISSKNAKRAITMYLPKRFLSAEFRIDRFSKVVTRHGTQLCHFRQYAWCRERSSPGIPCLIGNTYAKVYPQNPLLLFDVLWRYDAALKNFISHINTCWNSPKISIKMDGGHFSDFLDTMRYLNLNALLVDSVDFGKNVQWKFGEHFLQCKSLKLYYYWDFESLILEENLINFLELLVNYPQNQLEVLRILDCPLTVEVITNGLSAKGIAQDVTGSNLELQRCDGKKVLITLVDQVLEVKVI